MNKYISQVFVKEVTTIATKSASTILIAFVLITLILFAILRIFDVARVIQMNMEISIVLAHGCLILPSDTGAVEVRKFHKIISNHKVLHLIYTKCEIIIIYSVKNLQFQTCRVISILIHYFFTTCFMFMFLESIHMYSLVAFVVHKDGLMTRAQVK